MLSEINKETFQVGDVFKVICSEVLEVTLELSEIHTGRYCNIPGLRDPFILEFRSERTVRMEQGNYSIRQERIGDFCLTLVPMASPDNNQEYYYYQAIFN